MRRVDGCAEGLVRPGGVVGHGGVRAEGEEWNPRARQTRGHRPERQPPLPPQEEEAPEKHREHLHRHRQPECRARPAVPTAPPPPYRQQARRQDVDVDLDGIQVFDEQARREERREQHRRGGHWDAPPVDGVRQLTNRPPPQGHRPEVPEQARALQPDARAGGQGDGQQREERRPSVELRVGVGVRAVEDGVADREVAGEVARLREGGHGRERDVDQEQRGRHVPRPTGLPSSVSPHRRRK